MKSIIRILCILFLFYFSFLFSEREQYVYCTVSSITCFWCFTSTISYWLDLLFGNVTYHSFEGGNTNYQANNTNTRDEYRASAYVSQQNIKELETQLKNSLRLRPHKPVVVSSVVKSTYEDGTPIHITKTETITPVVEVKEGEKQNNDIVNRTDNNLVILNDVEKLDLFSEKVYKAIVGCLKSLIADKDKLWYLIDSIKHIENMSSGTVIYFRPLTTKYKDTTLPYEEIVKAIHYHIDDKTHFVSFHELKTQTLAEYYFNENIKE